jgi:hypothetical protein
MTLAARFEVFVFLDRFRNVDLFHQGEYAVRARVFTERSRVCALPVSTVTSSLVRNPSGLVEGGIDEEDASFCSSSFYIRYRDEQRLVNEGVIFALEMDVSADFVFEPVVVQFELMFNKPFKTGAAEAQAKQFADSSAQGLQHVSTHAFRFQPTARGLNSYAHLTFDELHTCGVDVTVHAALLFFTVKRPGVVTQQSKKKASKTIKGPGPKNLKLVKPKWSLSSFAEMLFPSPAFRDRGIAHSEDVDVPLDPGAASSSGTPRSAEKQRAKPLSIDQLHRCLALLAGSHQEMTSQFSHLSVFCEDRIQRERLEEALHVPQSRPIAYKPLDRSVPISALDAGDHVLKALSDEFSSIAEQVVRMWQNFLAAYCSSVRGIHPVMRRRHDDAQFLRWASCVYVETITPQESTMPIDSTRSVRGHTAIVSRLRKSPEFLMMKPLPLDDISLNIGAHNRPIIFEQRCTFTPTAQAEGEAPPRVLDLDQITAEVEFNGGGTHFFVMVHGFQGNQYDLRMFKNHLSYLYPDAEFIMSSCNEHDTYTDIGTMGFNLAKEMDRQIQASMLQVGRISFVGHSLGALLIRAALTTVPMRPYLSKLHTYVSLSGPHLGYLYSENSLLDSGMWFLKKWKNSAALHQLCLTDNQENLRSSFIYRLSEAKGLQHFKHVLLLSSPQDGYAPFYSSRVEVCQEALHDPKHGSLHMAMVNNLLRPLQQTELVRYEVFFNLHGKGIDNAIRRAAHIMFLESIPFIQMFVGLNRRFFD